MMSDEALTWLPIALLLLLIAYAMMRRNRRGRHDAVPEIAWLGYSETALKADTDFRKAFEGMIPDQETGISLLRISLSNRGDGQANLSDWETPVQIVLPQSTRVLSTKAVAGNGGVETSGMKLVSRLNHVEVAPFMLPPHSSVILNIVADGAAQPFDIYGNLRNQDTIRVMV